MITKKVNKSSISFYQNPPIHIKEYYNYCLSLIINLLEISDQSINIIFGNLPNTYNNTNKTIKIDIQCEHTLVKKGGRGVDKEIFGDTLTDEGDKYLIRIDKFDYYNSLDFVIEYSYPNYKNITSSDYFIDYSKKIIVIEPLILNPNFLSKNRTSSFSMFTNNGSTRRDSILKEFHKIDSNFVNISNCFSDKCLHDLYNKSKIMVNVHQTDHHHTFEELRVLPALSQGVIVISEKVPLKENIPYNNFIIWSDYEDLPSKLYEVQKNYEKYYNKIFNKNLLDIFEYINSNNKTQMSKILP